MAYEVEHSEVAYEGHLSTVRVDRVRFPDGEVADREVVEHPSAVAVVALDDEDRLVLLRQYRHPVRTRQLELPAGKLDVEGEEPAEAIRRELAEEAALEADHWEEILSFHNSSGWTDESTTLFLATGLRACAAPTDFVAEAEEAGIEVVRVPLPEALRLALAGEIPDAKTLIGVLWAAARANEAAN